MKDGKKTSEFWITLATLAVPLVNHIFSLDIPAESVASLVGVAAAYVLSRGVAKGGASK